MLLFVIRRKGQKVTIKFKKAGAQSKLMRKRYKQVFADRFEKDKIGVAYLDIFSLDILF